MNVNMQEFADHWSTKRGIRVRTTLINFQGETFVNGGRNIHMDRNSQVQRLRIIRKLYKIYIHSLKLEMNLYLNISTEIL